jgi:hypothetical protein
VTARLDPGVGFWLRYVASRGGLAEADGETHLAVLPEAVRKESGFDELVHVTGDPDIAREGTAVLLGAGHPALSTAADRVLAVGDVGTLALDGARPRPPDAETLLERARDQFPIDHGRIFATGSPTPATRTVLRIGALVTYTLSSDEHYQEQVEYWIDTDSHLPLSAAAARRLTAAEPLPARTGAASHDPAQLSTALAAARALIDEAALRRREELSAAAQKACAEEQQRAEDYYSAQITTLQQRLDTVPEDKKTAYRARIEATEAERGRRLAEIDEKYAPGHEVRPFRAHLVRVPAVRLPAEARRGERRHELRLDYLPAAGEYAGMRCPTCSSAAPLVLAKTGFGCERCQKRSTPPDATIPTAPRPAAKAVRAQRAAPESKPQATLRAPAPSAGTATASNQHWAKPSPQVGRTPPRPAVPAARQPEGRPGGPRKTRRTADPHQIAFALWQAVADGDRPKVESLCDPDSPAAAAIRLYGPGGLLVSLGLAPTACPTGAAGEPFGEWRGQRAFAGTVETRSGRQDFLLTWAHDEPPRVAELMPYSEIFRFGLLGLTSRGARADRTPPKPRLPLDPTAAHLWTVMPPTHDLQLTLRALAALWRLEDLDEYLARHDSRTVAAAVDRLVSYWSHVSGATYAEAAARYGVAEPGIRAAGTALQKELKLTRERPW